MTRVLIVEDEDIIRSGFTHTFDWLSMDCTVVGGAADGQQGLAMIEELKPDLVFVDIMMPVMNGIDMLKAAGENPPFKTVILTSHAEFDFAKQAVHLRVFDYLLKPVDEELLRNLLVRVKKQLDQEKVFQNVMERTYDKADLRLSGKSIYTELEGVLNPFVAAALAVIRNEYISCPVFRDLAERLNVSGSYLSRKIKEETGQTFHDLLNRYRVQKALELINTGRYRIYEISDRTGFSDYKHFCSVFKKYTGLAPSKFSRQASCIIREELSDTRK